MNHLFIFPRERRIPHYHSRIIRRKKSTVVIPDGKMFMKSTRLASNHGIISDRPSFFVVFCVQSLRIPDTSNERTRNLGRHRSTSLKTILVPVKISNELVNSDTKQQVSSTKCSFSCCRQVYRHPVIVNAGNQSSATSYIPCAHFSYFTLKNKGSVT